MHTSFHAFFHSISNEHYQKYVNASKEYNVLTNNNTQWDLLSRSAEENAQYFFLIRERTKHAVISVVFIAMSLEGLVNEYGLAHLGQQRFMESDKNRDSFETKLNTFYFEITGKPFPNGISLYQNIIDVMAVRNTLVHSKSIEIDIDVLRRNDKQAEEAFLSYINFTMGNRKPKHSKQKGIEKVLEKSHNVYNELKALLSA